MNRKLCVYISIFLLSASTGVFSGLFAQSAATTNDIAVATAAMNSRNAMDFTTELLDGTSFTFSETFNNKPSVLLFWCTWNTDCATCLSELEPLVQEFGDRVNFIAVNCSEPKETVAPFVQAQGFTGIVCLEKDYNISSLYDVYGMPQLVLVNKDGTIALRNTGMLPASRFTRFLTSMLRK